MCFQNADKTAFQKDYIVQNKLFRIYLDKKCNFSNQKKSKNQPITKIPQNI